MNLTVEELTKAGVTRHASGVYLVKEGTSFYPINEADIPDHIERRKKMEEQIATIEFKHQLLKLKKENRQIVIDNFKSIWFPSAILIIVVPILYYCFPRYFTYVKLLADKPLTLNILINVVFYGYSLAYFFQKGLVCFFELLVNISNFKKVKNMYLLSLWNESDWFTKTWIVSGTLIILTTIVASAVDPKTNGDEVGISCVIALFLPVILFFLLCALFVELFKYSTILVLVIIPRLIGLFFIFLFDLFFKKKR